MYSSSRSTKARPRVSACFTRAISSGLDAWNSFFDWSDASGYTGVTLLQSKKAKVKSLAIDCYCKAFLYWLPFIFLFLCADLFESRLYVLLILTLSTSSTIDEITLSLSSCMFYSSNISNSIATFLKTISFWVSVPVLSERRYWIRPNSSGIVVVLAIQPSICGSELIL